MGGGDFKFLTNQSSILYTSDTNDVTVNGVNVIVDKPKKGDVMCVTRYKDESGNLLPADKQKVVWVDGLSINLEQLSGEYEPVGICVVIKRNEAMVLYKWISYDDFAYAYRLELPNSSIMNDGIEHSLTITLKGKENSNPFVYTASTRAEFVEKLNAWFLKNDTDYSAELVELDTDLPAVDTSDTKDGNNYRNRIIINFYYDFYERLSNFIKISQMGNFSNVTANDIKQIDWFYKNNGFKGGAKNKLGFISFAFFIFDGCCLAKYYDYYSKYGNNPSSTMTSIDDTIPVNINAFNSNTNCQILRDNFANYDEYIDSMMVKFPCGKGGVITEFPSGKENTYKLADCTFLDNATGKQEILYPAANWAASIDINAPKLRKGNWWLPSAAEMVEIMHDITYGTSFWETKPDIVNLVLAKLTSISNSGWSMLSASNILFTSSICYSGSLYTTAHRSYIFIYNDINNNSGCLAAEPMVKNIFTSPKSIAITTVKI